MVAVGEAKKPVELCKTKKNENVRNYQGQKNREANTIKHQNLCGICHMEERPFHVAWYLQDLANDICSMFELQPSILHDDFLFGS